MRTLRSGLFLGLLLAGWTGLALPATAQERPNLIFILSDDLGIGGFSCYGSDQRKTPNIDALAKSGIRF